ncbi:MAG: SocA family protein [Phycisphaerales bacterium]|jgi:uncharacterized phage-associated protein|nr:SocA family protein [Phycisphaerales bacterium]
MTTFVFKFDKALQAAAYILRRESSHAMNYMRLLKILYIADRESLRQTGRPITGDRIAAMERGPVLSELLDLIKGEHLRSPDWENFIKRSSYSVQLVDEPGLANMSRFEIETLEKVAEEHRMRDEWDMVQYTHDHCPEWKKNEPVGPVKVNWIPLEDLLDALGMSDDLPAITEDIKADHEFANLFGA